MEVTNPRRLETRLHSPQLDHGPLSETEWLLADAPANASCTEG
jgi:hypothetical protein